jgi:hypothetical protein
LKADAAAAIARFPSGGRFLEAQFSACQPFQQERRLFAQPPTMHLARGEPASSQLASWPKEARFRAGAAAAFVTCSGEMSSFTDMSGAALIAQIAACVRLWTRIFRRIDLTWTFAVASEMASLRLFFCWNHPESDSAGWIVAELTVA